MNDNKAAWQERIERQNAKHFETMIRHAKTVAVCPKCGLREINPSMHCPSCLYEAVPVINGCLAVVGKKGLRCQRTPIPRANSWICAVHAGGTVETKTLEEWRETLYRELTDRDTAQDRPPVGEEGS